MACTTPGAAKVVAKLKRLATQVPCPGAKDQLRQIAQAVCSGKMTPAAAKKAAGI